MRPKLSWVVIVTGMFLLVVDASPSILAAESCLKIDVSADHFYLRLTDADRAKYEKVEQLLCQRIQDKETTRADALTIADGYARWLVMCENYRPRSSYWRDVYSWDPPPSAQRFCQAGTAVPTQIRVMLKDLYDETFCLKAEDMARPKGVLLVLGNLLFALPSTVKLKEQALSLCEQLRSGKIDLATAQYRLKREAEAAKAAQFGDLVAGYFHSWVRLATLLVAAIGVAGTLIGIFVGVKNLYKR